MAQQGFVRIGFAGDAKSNRQMPRFRLNPSNVNKVFNCDVEFLQEDDTVRARARACAPRRSARPPHTRPPPGRGRVAEELGR